MKHQIKIKLVILTLVLSLTFSYLSMTTQSLNESSIDQEFDLDTITLNIYDETFPTAFNIMEEMTLSPMFTPDNAVEIHANWIDQANDTIEVQNQYITAWDNGVAWSADPSPIVRSLIDANNRGVDIRVQINEPDPDDKPTDVTNYFLDEGIDVRWMGNSSSTPDDSYLSQTHNKMLLVDGKVSLISSINFGENAFTNNREAGMVIQNTQVTSYYQSIFEEDWADGEIPPTPTPLLQLNGNLETQSIEPVQYTTHTNIPRSNFTGTYNVSAFVNPDNADKTIFDALMSAQESVVVSMYTISRDDFTNALIDLKTNNPAIDIQVLISNRRVGGSENEDTHAAATSLVENLIPVYNSTKDDDKVDGFYHNKYWIIDGKHTFVYSGNWSPRSVTPEAESYSSGEANRDMGIAVYDAPDIASFFKTEVWDQDVAIADAWDLPIGPKITSISSGDVISETVNITGNLPGMEDADINYSFNDNSPISYTYINPTFSLLVDTTTLANGATTFTIEATLNEQIFTDSVTVNIINSNHWRLLITEVLPNPEVVSDTEGEFFEITNTFPFDINLANWLVGDNNDLYEFEEDDIINGYSSIIFARNPTGFQTGYGKTADYELSFSLTNTADYVIMFDNKDNIIDVVSYGAIGIDNSEALDAPGSGESLQRSPMYIDTNTVNDFIVASPDPKGTVPNIPLEATTFTSTGETSTDTTTPIETSETDTTPIEEESSSTGTDVAEFYIPIMVLFIPIYSRFKRID